MSLKPPFVVAGRFKAVGAISFDPAECEGGQGIVYKGLEIDSASVEEKPPRTLAFKVFKASAAVAKREAAMHARAAAQKHPNILDFVHFEEGLGHNGVLVMEVANCSFFQFAVDHLHLPLPTVTIAQSMRQVTAALTHLHSLGIAHLDLKLENILVCGDFKQPTFKLADFGFATDDVSPSPTQTRSGTDGFRAPELYGQVVNVGPGYDAFAADAWSLGVCIFIVAVGRLPFAERAAPPPLPPERPTPTLLYLPEFVALREAQEAGKDGVYALCQLKGIHVEWEKRVDAALKLPIERLLTAAHPATRREALSRLEPLLASLGTAHAGAPPLPSPMPMDELALLPAVSEPAAPPAPLREGSYEMVDSGEAEARGEGGALMSIDDPDEEPCSPPVFRGGSGGADSKQRGEDQIHCPLPATPYSNENGEEEQGGLCYRSMRGSAAAIQPSAGPAPPPAERLQRRWGAAA